MNNEYLNIKDYPDSRIKKTDIVEVALSIETSSKEGEYTNRTYITGADFKIKMILKGEESYKFFNFCYESAKQLKEAYLNIMSQLPETHRLKQATVKVPTLKELKDDQDYKQRVLKAIESEKEFADQLPNLKKAYMESDISDLPTFLATCTSLTIFEAYNDRLLEKLRYWKSDKRLLKEKDQWKYIKETLIKEDKTINQNKKNSQVTNFVKEIKDRFKKGLARVYHAMMNIFK